MAALGIDAPAAIPAPRPCLPRRCMKSAFNAAFAKQLPCTIPVSLAPGVSFNILPEAAHIAPAIEATASSLCQLHEAVQRDLEGDAPGPRLRAKAASKGVARRSPRGAPGQREYHDVVKQRWVTKVRLGKGKFRVLSRKVTPLNPVLPLSEPTFPSADVPPLVDAEPQESLLPVSQDQQDFVFGE